MNFSNTNLLSGHTDLEPNSAVSVRLIGKRCAIQIVANGQSYKVLDTALDESIIRSQDDLEESDGWNYTERSIFLYGDDTAVYFGDDTLVLFNTEGWTTGSGVVELNTTRSAVKIISAESNTESIQISWRITA